MSRSGALQVLWVVCKVPGSFQGCSCLVKEGLRQVQVLLPVGTIGVRIHHGPGRKRVIVLQQNLRVTGVGWIAFQVYRWNILPFYWLLSWQMRHEASCKNSYSVQHRMSSHGHGACRHTERLRNRAMRGPPSAQPGRLAWEMEWLQRSRRKLCTAPLLQQSPLHHMPSWLA